MFVFLFYFFLYIIFQMLIIIHFKVASPISSRSTSSLSLAPSFDKESCISSVSSSSSYRADLRLDTHNYTVRRNEHLAVFLDRQLWRVSLIFSHSIYLLRPWQRCMCLHPHTLTAMFRQIPETLQKERDC